VPHVKQEAKNRKAGDEEMLRKKLEARKRKKEAQVLKKQEEELAQAEREAEKSGQSLEEFMQSKMKAAGFAELREMVLAGRYDEAVMLLRRQHEQETRDMRGAHARETAMTMAPLEQEMAERAKSAFPDLLPPGPNVAEIEEKLNAKHKTMLADLEKRHRDELDALQSGIEMPGPSEAHEADVTRTVEEEKATRADKLKSKAEELKAKMEAELRKMEEDLEEQLRQEREEYELKKKELSMRAATQRQQLEEESEPRTGTAGSNGREEQTPDSLIQQHEEEKAAHATAVREQEQIQRRLLEEKIAFRKKQKDTKMAKDMSRKFREAVMNQDFLGSMANVNKADLAPQEREQVRAPHVAPHLDLHRGAVGRMPWLCATPNPATRTQRQLTAPRLLSLFGAD
jgi:hypothetical protein